MLISIFYIYIIGYRHSDTCIYTIISDEFMIVMNSCTPTPIVVLRIDRIKQVFFYKYNNLT